MDIVRDANGNVITEDNFFYGPVNQSTGLIDKIDDERLIDFGGAAPLSFPTAFELYYKRVPSLANDCPFYNPSLHSNIPRLEDNLTKVFTLKHGVKMTGAQIRKALVGY